MGKCSHLVSQRNIRFYPSITMAKKAMKAMKAMKRMKKCVKAMPKSAIADTWGAACEKKRSEVSKVLDALAELAGKEVKGTGKFTIPGVCMIKKRYKPATKAGKRMAFGELVKVKASKECREGLCFGSIEEECEVMAHTSL